MNSQIDYVLLRNYFIDYPPPPQNVRNDMKQNRRPPPPSGRYLIFGWPQVDSGGDLKIATLVGGLSLILPSPLTLTSRLLNVSV